MGATSSQDEFAKWAKLRRRHDKAMEEYDVKSTYLYSEELAIWPVTISEGVLVTDVFIYHPGKKLNAMKVSFDWTIKTVRWASTTGITIILQFWFSKSPIYDLPRGWFPWQVEWILSFPRAPLGTVSIQVWGGACGTVIALVGGAVAAIVPALKSSKQSKGPAVAQKTGTPRGSREQTPTRKTQ
ncbi:retrograde vesicle-mediated transport protein Get1, putative [Trichophyton benhamiae CBS 112371]|uniref:Retrograde vesicle-mediated transport protein Get1, putative n=1 Tax=Arthroderma benhamiae (strain ATCC MYA-4681 / CBS 112371) TaxID=663331 RepID=D4AZL3_ARTBC|nr:retrograde vesicle-mediated transport protein Get1, putative [Trichophyton benhamiae CBS 112371]EFE31483.1 retrograde vesicle-mediated transport protein Get1, putative [Trichophyton benhamiae CBS 112371]